MLQTAAGAVDDGEMKSLTESAIASIDLTGVATDKNWGWNDSVVVNTRTFLEADGTSGDPADVAFLYEGSAEPIETPSKFEPRTAESRYRPRRTMPWVQRLKT